MSRRTLVFSVRFAVVLLAFTSLAGAHAILLFSTPSASSVVKGSDVNVRLRFNSRIDAKRSQLTLVAPDGSQKALIIGEQPSPDLLNAQIRGLRSGPFVLRWQVLANDGHITRGEIPFRVE